MHLYAFNFSVRTLRRSFVCLVAFSLFCLILVTIRPYRRLQQNLKLHTGFATPHNLRTHQAHRTRLKDTSNFFVSPQSRTLILKASPSSADLTVIISALEAHRMDYVTVEPMDFHSVEFYLRHRMQNVSNRDTPAATGLVNLFIFEQFLLWTTLPSNLKLSIVAYCKLFRVGIIGFIFDEMTLVDRPDGILPLGNYPLLLHRLSSPPTGFYLAYESPVLTISKGGQFDPGVLHLDSINNHCKDTESHSNYSRLLGNAQLIADQFESQLPNYSSLLRRRSEGCMEKSTFVHCCMATLIPKTSFEHTFQTVAFTKVSSSSTRRSDYTCAFPKSGYPVFPEIYESLVIEDVGEVDGVTKIVFAYRPSSHWSVRLLLADSIRYLLKNVNRDGPLNADRFDLGLTRWFHVDIDDIFVAKTGSRLTPDDVIALVNLQSSFRKIVPNFTFNLGFSGGQFGNGSELERAGDDLLLRYAHEFRWFCHTWLHMQPHLLNETHLIEQLLKNKQFAQLHNLPIQEGYAVAPHHSGVYPVFSTLYLAWKKVWNITVSTTEGYPHLFPAWKRRGFAYHGIQILPRQTCGVYTHTLRLSEYPGGISRLDGMAFGGEIFKSLLYTPVCLFMTHFGNYGQDRLAPYVLTRALNFITSWTNLQLKTDVPQNLIENHLKYNPMESSSDPSAGLPIFSNPCSDVRHAAIWPSCSDDMLPSVLIGGPQKSGTTAMFIFMALHPNLVPNRVKTVATFEEVQFFSKNEIYANGVDWYLHQFPNTPEDLQAVNKHASRVNIRFEKSATYFDSELAPDRILGLLPKVKLIFILSNPIDRAHSWFQHQRALGNEVALNFSFDLILRASTLDRALSLLFNSTEKRSKIAADIVSLHRKCINPGFYDVHLLRWLHRFSAQRIFLLDRERLVSSPALVMDDVQEFLKVKNHVNYSSLLLFDEKKGFFCVSGGPHPVVGRLLQRQKRSNTWCLSRNKGRRYPHLETEQHNIDIFRQSLRNLYQMLLVKPFWRPRRLSSALDTVPSWFKYFID